MKSYKKKTGIDPSPERLPVMKSLDKQTPKQKKKSLYYDGLQDKVEDTADKLQTKKRTKFTDREEQQMVSPEQESKYQKEQVALNKAKE